MKGKKMGFFDFFRRKKEAVEPQNEPVKEIKQGFYREREYFPANPLCKPNTNPEYWMTVEGEYKDNGREGCWLIKDKKGHERGYINYQDGRKHGLEKEPFGGYTLYYHGQAV